MKTASNDFGYKDQRNSNSYLRLGFVVVVVGLLAMYPSCSLARPTLSPTVLAAETSVQPHVLSTDQTPEKGDAIPPPIVHGVELPFRFSEGFLIMVEGQIGTQANLKFILDTGATISVVDSRIADKLKLPCHPAESLSFDRKLVWQSTIVPEVQFGQVKAMNIQMLVGHLGKYSEFVRKADAIIGMDLLKLSNFTIDFDTHKVVFHSFNQTIRARTGDPLSNCVLLEIRVQDHPIPLILDTGFPGILLFEERLITTVPSLEFPEKHRKVIVGDGLHAKQTTLRDIAIGSTRRDVAVLLAKSPAADVLPGIVGVAGISALNAHRVNFNFVDRKISWE